MKKFICSIVAVMVIMACALSGCSLLKGSSGRDGRDGQDLNIYDIYEAVRAEEGNENLSFLDFLREYLHYDFEYSEADSLQAVMNRSVLSAVAIFTTFRTGGYFGYGKDETYAGSGVIVDIDKEAGNAYILTNAHVVYKSDSSSKIPKAIDVFLYGNDDIYSNTVYNNYSISAEVVTYSISYDLALLKVENSSVLRASNATAAVFAESDDVHVGETVYTVGNPEGTGISVTAGIISRESEFIAVDFAEDTDADNNYRVMRTDTAVNGGNSGGALFDSSGRIVGIINAKDSDAENENMGYALCGSYVKRLWKLMRDGYLSTDSKSSYGIRRAVFPSNYKYTSEAYFDKATNLTEIRDTVKISVDIFSDFSPGDVIKHIKIVDGSGATVEDVEVTRFYNLDDVIISARDGYKIIYTVERDGGLRDITTDPTFKNYV